jgi:hypothetical protein
MSSLLPLASAPVARPSFWGPWATTGFLFLILGGMLLVQLVTAVLWLAVASFHSPGGGPLDQIAALQYDGDLLSVTTVAGTAAVLVLVAALVWLRRGAPLREYLALKPVRWKTAALWVAGTLAFLISYDLISRVLDRPAVPDFMLQVYGSATMLPLLWIAIVIAAPLWEEIVFRGFAFPGLRSAGLALALVVPALLWTSLHLQYDAFDMTYVFCLGLLFGLAREHTGSVVMPIVLHVFTNALATIQVALG